MVMSVTGLCVLASFLGSFPTFFGAFCTNGIEQMTKAGEMKIKERLGNMT